MSDSDDGQWDRISAEAELRPDRGLVADVPVAQITPVPADEPMADPIELNEVPASAPGLEVEPEADSVPPIQVVPFRSGPLPEAGPDVIVAAPFDVRAEAEPVVVEQPAPMITEVPVPHPDPVEVLADLPDEQSEVAKTSWWRLMLGGGESRADRRVREPEAAAPQPSPSSEPEAGPSSVASQQPESLD